MKVELTIQELRAIQGALLKANALALPGTNEAAIKEAVKATGIANQFVARKLREIETTNLEKNTWDRWCGSYGLRSEDFGKQFFLKGRAYEILSLNPSAPKYAVNAKRLPDGKVFAFRWIASCAV